jgi:hypothetical protein
VFRIVTEDKNVEGIKPALVSLDLGFTVFRGIGSWKNKEELRVAVEPDHISPEAAERVVRKIKMMNDQEAALLQEFPINTNFP